MDQRGGMVSIVRQLLCGLKVQAAGQGNPFRAGGIAQGRQGVIDLALGLQSQGQPSRILRLSGIRGAQGRKLAGGAYRVFLFQKQPSQAFPRRSVVRGDSQKRIQGVALLD